MRRFLTFLSGVLSGAVLGAVVVLLYTPTSGSDLKKSIQKKVSVIQTDMKAAYDERKDQLETELENLRQGHIVLKD